jgi:maltooligosyltrehalose synthase
MVVVPRLSARLTGFHGEWPLGSAAWGDTWLSIDHPDLHGEYVDRLSGLRVSPELHDGKPALSLAKLFEVLPVAMLQREGRS